MNKLEILVLIEEKNIKSNYLEAYRTKIINLVDAFFDDVEDELEYEHSHERDEHGFFPDEVREDFDYHYEHLSSKCVAELCSDLCISNGVFIDSKQNIQYQGEFPTTIYRRYDIWKYIKELDSIDFLVATISLFRNISENTKFGKWFVITVKKILRDYEFDFILEKMKKNKVFIAMSFSKEMNKAREKIKQAVDDSGYNPILIDEKEHCNSIVPEIFYEINESIFVIADFSENKSGVYYEAGYAKGLGKKVIMAVRKKDFKKVHFDTKQVSHIIWDDEDDLYKKLLTRINATI